MSCCKYYGDLKCEHIHACDRCEIQAKWRENERIKFAEFRRMTELKPCPFCGGQVRITRSPMGLIEVEHIEDNECLMNVMDSQWWGDIEPFIEQWNRRAHP